MNLKLTDHLVEGMIEDTKDKLRIAELKNIRQIIQSLIGLEDDGINEELEEIRQRIDFLTINPKHAGENEKYRC